MESEVPGHTRIVIVGGGIMGVSLLYHLAGEGCSDVLLIEKGELTSGSTWHAAGQCPSLVGNYNLAKIHHYGNTLYPQLEALTGQYVSWHASGSIRVARTRDDLDWFHYMQGIADNIGFGMQIIGQQYGFLSRCGLSNDLNIRVAVELGVEHLPEQRLVFDYYDLGGAHLKLLVSLVKDKRQGRCPKQSGSTLKALPIHLYFQPRPERAS